MSEKPFVKPWIFDKISQAGLVDGRGVVFRSVFAQAPTKSEVAANIAKSVLLGGLLGYYTTEQPEPMVISLSGDYLHIIPLKSIKKKSTPQDIISSTFTIQKESVHGIRVQKKSFGLFYLYLTNFEQEHYIAFNKKQKGLLKSILGVYGQQGLIEPYIN
ncbi:MAG: hypothetical protein FWD86_00885 [Firmicutes bacterium]|nr:hypothetical protein [Bacillota bacterium]